MGNQRLSYRPCDWPNPIILASAWRAGPVGLRFVGQTFLSASTFGKQECLPHGPIVAVKRPGRGSHVVKTLPFYATDTSPFIIQVPRLRYI
jgi:hypothetical protein